MVIIKSNLDNDALGISFDDGVVSSDSSTDSSITVCGTIIVSLDDILSESVANQIHPTPASLTELEYYKACVIENQLEELQSAAESGYEGQTIIIVVQEGTLHWDWSSSYTTWQPQDLDVYPTSDGCSVAMLVTVQDEYDLSILDE